MSHAPSALDVMNRDKERLQTINATNAECKQKTTDGTNGYREMTDARPSPPPWTVTVRNEQTIDTTDRRRRNAVP